MLREGQDPPLRNGVRVREVKILPTVCCRHASLSTEYGIAFYPTGDRSFFAIKNLSVCILLMGMQLLRAKHNGKAKV